MLGNKGRHDTTKLGPNAVQKLKINQRRILIDSLEIGIPAPEQMIALGERQLPNGIKVGQLLNSKTLNYKKFTPHRDGLFCERIFGPVQSFVCACGKKKESVQNKSRQKDLVKTKLLPEVGEAEVTSPFQKEALFCPKCQVEYISKNVRRHRLGYIKLFAPVTHIWYLKGRPSYLSLFLGKRKKAITSLAYCNGYLVEQVYSHLEKKNQVKDTSHFISNGVTKLKQNQALSTLSMQNEPSCRSEVRNNPASPEHFFTLLSQLFPERHVKKLSFTNKSQTIKGPNVSIKKVYQLSTELALTKTEFLLKQDVQQYRQKSNLLPAFLSLNKGYANWIQPYLLTKRYRAVTKLVSWLKLPPERSLGTINDKVEQSGYQNDKLSGNQKKVNQNYNRSINSSVFQVASVNSFVKVNAHAKQSFSNATTSSVPAEKSTDKFLLSPYVRAQTLPFLPSLICSFHLRDCLISFLQSSPRTEDISIPLYCQTPRRYPLRDVHKFLTEFRSITTKDKAERLSSESIKKFTGLFKQAKPVLNKNKAFVQSYSKTSPNKAIKDLCSENKVLLSLKNKKSCRDVVIHKFRHANLFSRDKINVFKYKNNYRLTKQSFVIPVPATKKHKIDDKGIPSAYFLPIVKSFSGYIQKPNVTAKVYNRSNTFTKLKVSTLAVNLGLTKRKENLSMSTQFLARKTTISGMLLNTFIATLLTKTAPILCRLPLLKYKYRSTFTPLAETKLQNKVTFYNLYKQKTKLLQKLSFCIPSINRSVLKKQSFFKLASVDASAKSSITRFATNVVSGKNSVKSKSNKEIYSCSFGKTNTHNALVKAKFLPMHYQSKNKNIFNSDVLNFQLIAAEGKFKNKGNLLFNKIETYQKRLLHLVFGTLLKSQSIKLYEGVTKPKQKVNKSSTLVKSFLPFYSFFTNNYYSPFVKREKIFSSSSEHLFPSSFDLVKSKLIARLDSNQDCISQNKNNDFQIYSSRSCTILVKHKSEKGVTFFSRSHPSFVRNIGSNGILTAYSSIKLPFFISGSKQNKVCLITQKENQIEWTTFGKENSAFLDHGEKKSFTSYVPSTAFISSSLPDAGVWSCTLVKRFSINSCFHSNKENVVFLDVGAKLSMSRQSLVNEPSLEQSYLKTTFLKSTGTIRHSRVSSESSSAKTCIEQTHANKFRTIPHKLHSERYVKIRVPAKLQSNLVLLPEQGSALSENLVCSKQKSFAQSSNALTNVDSVKANSRSSIPVSEGEVFTQTISKWHINGAKEILLYTGGGALESLLKRFNISLFCQFLFGEIQILRKYYKDQIAAEFNKNKIVDERKNSPSQGVNEYAYIRKNKNEVDLAVSKRNYDFMESVDQAEIQDSYQVGPERHFGLKYVVTDKNVNLFCRRIYRTTRRLKIVQLLMRSKRRPEWMMISVLPVLPPDLRPVLQMGENLIVASDLNTLYQRVIYRNNRHYKGRFLDFHFVSSIHRLVQDAVDRLIENGKGGSTPFLTPGGRPLKSLSDILKGKRGRFRFNLLGKRVDFSGRSVIVVSPNLKIHECGLPREMALELYKYLLIRQLLLKKKVSSIVNAKKLIKQRKPLIWDMLREIIYYHPLLLNRAPTLHRLGIQAFQPKLALGNAILLHPLVCAGFNADFDGDQMGVHLPLSPQARAEAWDLLWSRNNLLSPATGQPILLPSQDMVLGFYYMTALLPYGTTFRVTNSDDQKTTYKNNVLPVVYVFSDTFQVVNAYQKKQIDIHTPIWLKRIGKSENGEKSQIPLELRMDIFGYTTQIYPTYKSKSKVFFNPSKASVNSFVEIKGQNASFLAFNKNKVFTEHIRTTVGRVLVNNLISKNN